MWTMTRQQSYAKRIPKLTLTDLRYAAKGLAMELRIDPPDTLDREELIGWILGNIGRLRRTKRYLN